MVDRVANQMNDRGKDALAHGFVELGVASVDHELDLFAGCAIHTAYEQRHALQKLTDGNHARFGNRSP
jgi:hypothetical protein